MIYVAAPVLRGIIVVKDSGLTNMFDEPVVAQIAAELGYPEASAWTSATRGAYSRGVIEGFALRWADYGRRERDLDAMCGEHAWPHGEVLPVKRLDQENGEMHFGRLRAGAGPVVHTEDGGDLAYACWAALLDDGWTVD